MEGIAEVSMRFQDSMSILGIFASGSLMVKLVILVLASFSLVSWAIIFKKSWAFNKLYREIRDLEVFLSSQSVATGIREIVECGSGIVSQILRHGVENAKLVTNKKEGFDKFVSAELSRTACRLEEQLELLSMVGSSSFSIGLFGAVWSVLENLKVLYLSQSGIEIGVLYPFIGEILYTVALGLLVSIPANIFYKKFTASADKIFHRLSGIVYELGVFVSNDEC
ncbi:MAG: MotA/TolQ/ExbB proton channel family protein [Aaplasma endosymbiont of Hyalomma asiaticum]